MALDGCYRWVVLASVLCGIMAQSSLFRYENGFPTNSFDTQTQSLSMMVPPTAVPEVANCPLEVHPDTETMFIMRGPLGTPEPRVCPPATIFMRSVCSCVNRPLDKCNLRPSPRGARFYEEYVFDLWIERPCGPGSGFNPATCDCSLNI